MGAMHRLFFHGPLDILFSKPEWRKVVLAHHFEDILLTPLIPIFEAHEANPDFILQSLPPNVLKGLRKWFGQIGIK
jgi:hypothetical protein